VSLKSNASSGNVAYASEYSVDKIVGIYTGSFAPAGTTTTLGGYLYQYTISHSFTRPVYTELLVSTDGINYQDGGPTGSTLSGISYSDSSKIYITTNKNTGTIYYKVICSWIDNYDGTNPLITPVLNTTNKAYFDSRKNYQKLFMSGTQSATSLGSDNIFTITHNLGYTPNFKIFFESVSGQVWPQISGGTNDFWLYDYTMSECYGVVDSTNLKIDCFPAFTGHTTNIWYRIYLDQ
jgi:hypothetical protein